MTFANARIVSLAAFAIQRRRSIVAAPIAGETEKRSIVLRIHDLVQSGAARFSPPIPKFPSRWQSNRMISTFAPAISVRVCGVERLTDVRSASDNCID